MKGRLLTIWLIALMASPSFGQDARAVLKQVIAYYDPQGVAAQQAYWIRMAQEYPGAPRNTHEIIIRRKEGSLWSKSTRNGVRISRSLRNGRYEATVEERANFPAQLRDSLRLKESQIKGFCDYYLYIYSMPFNLDDARATLALDEGLAPFGGTNCLALRILYDGELDREKWIYYIDPRTYRLVGARFYYKDPAKDGEFGLFQGEVAIGAIRLPKIHQWYDNVSGKFLGQDVLETAVPID